MVPPVGLQDGHVIVFFILADFVGNFHPLPEELHQFVINMIDLLS